MVKIIIRTSLTGIAFVIYALCAPNVLAQVSSSTSVPSNFCDKIGQYSDEATQDIQERKDNLAAKHLEIAQKLTQNREQRTNKLDLVRKEWAQKKDSQYDALLDKASLSQKSKAAVLVYRSSIGQLDEKQRNAVDNVIKAFRNELDDTINERKIKIEQAAVELENSVKLAFVESINACSSTSNDTANIKTSLRQKIISARQLFVKQIANINSAKNQRISFSRQRKADIDKIIDDFRINTTKSYDQFEDQYYAR